MTEIEPIQPREPWAQRTGEAPHQHAWLLRYCELGESRTIDKVARLCGVPIKLVRAAALEHAWITRAASFDAACMEVARAAATDEKMALSMQYEVGIAMMRLGVKAVQLKNPALIRMKDIRELMQQGAEMARRGAGVADLNIEVDVQKRVEADFLDLLGDDE